MAGSNEGFFEPCWVPVKTLVVSTSDETAKLERYEDALREIASFPMLANGTTTILQMRAAAREALDG